MLDTRFNAENLLDLYTEIIDDHNNQYILLMFPNGSLVLWSWIWDMAGLFEESYTSKMGPPLACRLLTDDWGLLSFSLESDGTWSRMERSDWTDMVLAGRPYQYELSYDEEYLRATTSRNNERVRNVGLPMKRFLPAMSTAVFTTNVAETYCCVLGPDDRILDAVAGCVRRGINNVPLKTLMPTHYREVFGLGVTSQKTEASSTVSAPASLFHPSDWTRRKAAADAERGRAQRRDSSAGAESRASSRGTVSSHASGSQASSSRSSASTYKGGGKGKNKGGGYGSKGSWFHKGGSWSDKGGGKSRGSSDTSSVASAETERPPGYIPKSTRRKMRKAVYVGIREQYASIQEDQPEWTRNPAWRDDSDAEKEY